MPLSLAFVQPGHFTIDDDGNDADGNGAGAAVRFAALDPALAPMASDFAMI